MVKSCVKVVLRTRPTRNFAHDSLKIVDGQDTLQVNVPRGHAAPKQFQPEQYTFRFDNILHEASQEEVFDVCARDVIDSFLDGYNGTILCYGQTGAGKTYTMTGAKDSFKSRGIIPRTISEVFNAARERTSSVYTVRISYAEIYNEAFFDLLEPATPSSSISVSDGVRGAVHMKGLSALLAPTEGDAFQLLFEGETARAIGEHQLNKSSSRSHTVFTLYLERKGSPDDPSSTTSKLHLVDLAGSERLSKTRSEGQVAKEATYINKSLSFLEQVVVALSSTHRDHVPYRSSKLTHMLKDSIGGNSKTLMVANVWGEAQHLEETMSTCRFAQRMMRIQNEFVVNVATDSSAAARRLEREVAELKEELAMHDQMANRSGVSYEPYTDQQRRHLEAQVREFLEADADDASIGPIEIISLRHVREALLACRRLYKTAAAAAAVAPQRTGSPPSPPSPRTPVAAPGSRARIQDGASDDEGAQVAGRGRGGAGGDEEDDDDDDGMAAPDDARPESGGEYGRGVRIIGPAGEQHARARPPDKKAAFETFQKGPGAEKTIALQDNKVALKESKDKQKAVATDINGIKRQIDEAKAKADALKEQREAAGGQELGEGEEYSALLLVKELKGKYKGRYQELQALKSEAEYIQQLAAQCKNELLADFEAWWEEQYGAGNPDNSFDDIPDVVGAATPPPQRAQRQAAAVQDSPKKSPGASPSKGAAAARARLRATQPAPPVIPQEELDDPEAAAYWRARSAMERKLHDAHMTQGPRSQAHNRGKKQTGFSTVDREAGSRVINPS
ncbi:unnamed protein product [Pedinophyceae sp. YPF-701]|nr:unnamed protein product [Pedinophyceae sp. YPF-701]